MSKGQHSVALDPDVAQKLSVVARVLGVSVQKLATEAVSTFLSEKKHTELLEALEPFLKGPAARAREEGKVEGAD